MQGSKYFVYRNALARKIAAYCYEKAIDSKSKVTIDFNEIEKVFNTNLRYDRGLIQLVDEDLYEFPDVVDTQLDENSITIWIF